MSKEDKKDRKKFSETRFGREIKGFIPSLLSAAAESTGILPTVLNLGARLIGKKRIPNMTDTLASTKTDTIVKDGEHNITKNTFLILFGVLVLNAVASKYLGLEILPEGFLNGILQAFKSIILDTIMSLFK